MEIAYPQQVVLPWLKELLEGHKSEGVPIFAVWEKASEIYQADFSHSVRELLGKYLEDLIENDVIKIITYKYYL
ncbi:MAG TPA: hypothetical protein VFQ59_02545 [Candidatus Paceibacterota bacterium]|nr:hypothetical protein [Candidatus Paceibacterota bacterium]